MRKDGTAKLASFDITLEDLVITEVPKSGWMVASNDGESVALALALSPALISAGNLREVVRLIQERRKSDGFEISDRIRVRWNSTAEMTQTIIDGTSHICDEVLATEMVRDESLDIGGGDIGVVVAISKA